MPPFQRRRYRYYNYWRRNNWYPRRTRKWRFRSTLRRTRKRRKPVRRKRLFIRYKRKFKKLKLNQWQPVKIKNCKIKGYLELFQFGRGRVSFNYAQAKDSFAPEHQPSGGGWSLQQLTLSNLYFQNCMLMNWWTRSNQGLNLVRILGSKVTLFRQQNIDYIFCYLPEEPPTITKYFYPSLHPIKLLTSKNKIIIPSFKTQPHKRKPYKTIKIRPPREMIDKWYFQQHVSDYPILKFAVTSCDLSSMFLAHNTPNNNITLHCLNTNFFKSPNFQYTNEYKYANNVTLWGLENGQHILKDNYIKDCIYLGYPHINDPGDPINNNTMTTYGKNHWGNPFYWKYLHGLQTTFITNQSLNYMITHKEQKLSTITTTIKTEPLIIKLRYNPDKDKGTGNRLYWVPNSVATKTNWDPPSDPSLIIEGFPMWIMLWGWADYTARTGAATDLNNNWILVFNCSYLNEKLPYIVILNETFINGQGPYDVTTEEISVRDSNHWYPKFEFQKEALNDIINTGPGVCKLESQKSAAAHMKYMVSLKWGGNPAEMEKVYDPQTQPIYPNPSDQLLRHEIDDPKRSITQMLYTWDTRRDFITQSAQKRITTNTDDDDFMFTDGTTSQTTDVPLQAVQTTPPKTTSKETQETIQQLQQLRELNNQLRNRFLQLKSLINST
nr:MAG: ORF1 [TTV-like mini virus]